ncbi:MAG: UDP-N-acetylmuramoyl-L-alanine--D-glutamate ligase [Actinobacteria bacterium]|nr:UDP-N-acetylmuramoyl-L-alanine--D-glutamate ligase [Actinomycetota bacterium]
MLPNTWHTRWGFRVAVLGLGKSGFSVADTLIELGSEVTVFAAKAEPELAEMLDVIGARLIQSDDPEAFDSTQFDFVVVSPGFPPSHPLVRKCLESGLELYTDIDLAHRLDDKVRKPSWLTITGTNGKTTTTQLTEAMLRESGHRVTACGNIGTPILDAVRDPQGFDFLVVELSSFQLHYSGSVGAKTAAFLNFAEDHYDWHGSEAAYHQAKSKIYRDAEVAIVYNVEDPKTLIAAEEADVVEGCRAIGFTTGIPARSMVGYVEEFLVDRAFIENRADAALEICSEQDLASLGVLSKHLKANIAAATAMARSVGVSAAHIRAALMKFRLAGHRIEVVAEHRGVTYVDDSKATNAHAADASLSSFESVVWIVGGLLKGVNPKPLIQKHAARLRGCVVIGKDTQLLEQLFAELLPELPVEVIRGGDTMQGAVAKAASLAHEGDIVLLAPSAASMDQFRDYEDRGNQFQAAVRELIGK